MRARALGIGVRARYGDRGTGAGIGDTIVRGLGSRCLWSRRMIEHTCAEHLSMHTRTTYTHIHACLHTPPHSAHPAAAHACTCRCPARRPLGCRVSSEARPIVWCRRPGWEVEKGREGGRERASERKREREALGMFLVSSRQARACSCKPARRDTGMLARLLTSTHARTPTGFSLRGW